MREAAAAPKPHSALQCFYINLASRPDREQRRERMLEQHAIPFVRVEAVTKDAEAVRDILDEFPAKRAGNVACSLSHFEVWRLVVQLRAGRAECSARA